MTLWDLHQRTEAEWRRAFSARPAEATAWIRLAAQNGFRTAQLVLGQMHLDGHGVPRDHAVAHGWFAKAAATGSLKARNMVGRCHELGWGVPIDHGEALRHYRKAAGGGLAWGHYNVGCLLLYGTGIRRNHAEAFGAFEAASALGHAKATGMLGRCHEEGWGTAIDREAARALYCDAADEGDGWAALNLGLMLIEDSDMAGALASLRRAVDVATPNCLSAIARTLGTSPEPVLASIAVDAALRMASAAAVGPRHDPSTPSGNPSEPPSRPGGIAASLASWRLAAAVLAAGLTIAARRRSAKRRAVRARR